MAGRGWFTKSEFTNTEVAMTANRQLFEYHPVFAYRFVPGLKARVQHEGGGYLVRANEAGFRCDHEFVRERTPGTKRVLLFGDSFTAGDGVSNGKRFGEVLEQLLPGVEVYNFGLSGTGTDQQYLVWKELVAGGKIEHDLVLIAVQVENIRRIVARYRTYANDQGKELVYAKPYFELVGAGGGGGGAGGGSAKEELRLGHMPPGREPIAPEDLPESERGHVDQGGRLQAVRAVVNALGLKDLVQRVTRYQPLPEYDSAETPAWRLMRAIMTKWVGEHRGQGQPWGGVPVMLVPVPLYMYVEGTSDASRYQARFAELWKELGLLGADPLPEMLKRSAEERRKMRFEKDVHPTPEGHEAIAKGIAGAVAKALGREGRGLRAEG